MPWLSVNHTRLAAPSAVPTRLFARDVQRASIPGQPGACGRMTSGIICPYFKRVLVIDVGGTHVKVRATGRTEPVKIPSGPSMTPKAMVAAVKKATDGWLYDAVSIGY